MSKKNKAKIIFLACLLLFSLDRITKYFFVFQPDLSLVVNPELLVLELHKNSGVAFGFLIGNAIYYVLFCLIFLALFYLLVSSYKKGDAYLLSCLALIIAGAVSNLLDRLRWGGVIDFINVPFWSVFNLADSFIVIGVVLWLIKIIFYERVHSPN